MNHYQKPPELYDGLRLHQNENTGGCSPRVLEALARLRPEDVGFYPPYQAAVEACARYLGVAPDHLALTNGLDEGIMALSVATLRPPAGGPVPEAIVPEPAFEIYRFDTAVAGGRLVQIMPKPDFAFPLDEVLAAITPATRVVFLTNPNNPTGVAMPLDAIRTIARRVPKRRDRLRRRGVRRIRRHDVHPRAALVSERHRRPDVLEGVRPGGPAHRRARRRAGRARPDPPRDPGLQREHRGRRRRAGGARGSGPPPRTTCGRSTSRRRCSTRRAIAWA